MTYSARNQWMTSSHADDDDLFPAVQRTPTTLRLSCMGRAAVEPTSTRRLVALMSPRWSPLLVVGCPLMAWWASLWTWAAAISSPAEAPTWSTEGVWREAVTTYHTHHAPPQLWWAPLIQVLFDTCLIERVTACKSEVYTPENTPGGLFYLFSPSIRPDILKSANSSGSVSRDLHYCMLWDGHWCSHRCHLSPVSRLAGLRGRAWKGDAGFYNNLCWGL